MDCQLLPSNKGKDKIVFQGYTFTFDRQGKNGQYYWHCDKSYKTEVIDGKRIKRRLCMKRLTTRRNQDGIHMAMPDSVQHSHESTPAVVEVKLSLAKMKEKAKETMAKPARIMQDVKGVMAKETLPLLPKNEAMRKMIKRQQRDVRKKEPQTLEQIGDLDDEFKVTISGEPFLLRQITNERTKIMIFSTRKNIRLMCDSSYWILDGTFKIAPNIFYQLFTIHCNVSPVGNKIFPMVYCLMSGKSSDDYEQLFHSLLEIINEFQFELKTKIAISDYELQIGNSLQKVIGSIEPTGCYFHLKQAIMRRLSELQLRSYYDSSLTFRVKITMLGCLAFLPPPEIPDAFRKLKEVMPASSEQLVKYFEDNWVLGKLSQVLRNGNEIRGRPRFKPELWSVHERNSLNIPRTQNAVEGWHNKMNGLVQCAHPGLFKLINEIKLEEHAVSGEVTKFIRADVQLTQESSNIAALVGSRGNDVLDFLETLANIIMN